MLKLQPGNWRSSEAATSAKGGEVRAGCRSCSQEEKQRRCVICLEMTNTGALTVSQQSGDWSPQVGSDGGEGVMAWLFPTLKPLPLFQGMGGQAVKADTVDGCLTFLLTFRLYRM